MKRYQSKVNVYTSKNQTSQILSEIEVDGTTDHLILIENDGTLISGLCEV